MEIQNRAANRFASTVTSISDKGFADANRAHYLEFRNRAHSTALKWALQTNHIPLAPLMQPEFVAASAMIDTESREAGRVAHDIIEMIEPELNDLAFQSGPWACTTNRPAKLDWDTAYPVDLTSWNSRVQARPLRQTQFRATRNVDARTLIAAGLTDMRTRLHSEGIDSTILDPLIEEPPEDVRGQGRWLARLATAAQCLADPGPAFAQSSDPSSPVIITLETSQE